MRRGGGGGRGNQGRGGGGRGNQGRGGGGRSRRMIDENGEEYHSRSVGKKGDEFPVLRTYRNHQLLLLGPQSQQIVPTYICSLSYPVYPNPAIHNIYYYGFNQNNLLLKRSLWLPPPKPHAFYVDESLACVVYHPMVLPGSTMADCDGCYKARTTQSGYGVVVSTDQGEVMCTIAGGSLQCVNSIYHEVESVNRASRFCHQHRLHKLEMFSDCQTAIRLITKRNPNRRDRKKGGPATCLLAGETRRFLRQNFITRNPGVRPENRRRFYVHYCPREALHNADHLSKSVLTPGDEEICFSADSAVDGRCTLSASTKYFQKRLQDGIGYPRYFGKTPAEEFRVWVY